MIRLGRDAGFTIIELVIGAGIASIMFAALYSFYRSQVFATYTEETAVNLKEEADVGLDFILKELRVAGARPTALPAGGCSGGVVLATLASCTGGFQRITDARAQSVTIQYDYRGDAVNSPPEGCPNDPNEKITYSYNAGPPPTISRTAIGIAGGAAVSLVTDATDFRFRYRSASGVLDPPIGDTLNETQRSNIVKIEVTITARKKHPDPRIGGQVGTTRVSTAFLRNSHC